MMNWLSDLVKHDFTVLPEDEDPPRKSPLSLASAVAAVSLLDFFLLRNGIFQCVLCHLLRVFVLAGRGLKSHCSFYGYKPF